MKKISLALVMASTLALTACGDGSSETSEVKAGIGANGVTIKPNRFGNYNTCGGGAPTVVFGGTDSQGRALFNVITRNISRVPQIGRDSSCDIAPVLLFPGLKVRVKGITYLGSWTTQNGAFGQLDVSAGPRTAFTYTASQFVSGNNPNFLKSDFSMINQTKFTGCGDASIGEILMTRPSVKINGGIAGKTPFIFPTLKEVNISIEAVKC